MLSRLLPDPLQTFPLGVTDECEGRAGSGESSSLLFWFPLISNVWAPPVMALDCYVFGIKPPCPFLFPVQMPKLCAPAGFELWEIN